MVGMNALLTHLSPLCSFSQGLLWPPEGQGDLRDLGYRRRRSSLPGYLRQKAGGLEPSIAEVPRVGRSTTPFGQAAHSPEGGLPTSQPCRWS